MGFNQRMKEETRKFTTKVAKMHTHEGRGKHIKWNQQSKNQR
jgi:hypothetical protein